MEAIEQQQMHEANQLSANYRQRHNPTDVFHWQDIESWKGVIWRIMDDVLTEAVKSAFLQSPPEYVVGDDLSWLNTIVLNVLHEDIDSKQLLAERFDSHYKALRVYHGARAENLTSYYEKGLIPLNPDTMHERARNIFLSGQYPELTEELLEKAIAAVGHEYRGGRVYFEANEKLLINQCGHYMLYGSEYLACIAVNLPSRNYQSDLKKIGRPVMLVCDVPIEMISGSVMLELAGWCLQMIFENLLFGEVEDDEPGLFGFCIHRALPSQCIVGHYHPVAIRDPLLYGG
ncbi:hypothetical protein [Porticoccus sp.]|uniref:hypothetical protein n=1 Tax=Porticoccus sp. TaxID=2024853 RepID=UPI000C52A3BD|nr:hypothetical protein [Porticoccus sp.]MAZ69785.1 hypothetical protein [Porticoccus sp.]|tara:strand:- start:192 stop:1055 length:864 start_codon:yes stop_codon:yes gene_type:complete